MSHEFNHPIIGQEAIVPDGVGRVVSYEDKFPTQYIEVKPYMTPYPMKFDPKNVELVEIITETNAKLIAAAPELLEACKMLVMSLIAIVEEDGINGYNNFINQGEQAIQKAGGMEL